MLLVLTVNNQSLICVIELSYRAFWSMNLLESLVDAVLMIMIRYLSV
jgi:hypothetical protein